MPAGPEPKKLPSGRPMACEDLGAELLEPDLALTFSGPTSLRTEKTFLTFLDVASSGTVLPPSARKPASQLSFLLALA